MLVWAQPTGSPYRKSQVWKRGGHDNYPSVSPVSSFWVSPKAHKSLLYLMLSFHVPVTSSSPNTLNLWVVAAPINLNFHISPYGSFIPSAPSASSLFVNKPSSVCPDCSVPSVSMECLTVTEIETTDCLWSRLHPALGLREPYLDNMKRKLGTGGSYVEKEQMLERQTLWLTTKGFDLVAKKFGGLF